MSFTLKKTFPPLPKTTRGQLCRIEKDPKNSTLLYSNGLKVVLRNLQDPSESDVYSQHSKPATAAKYAPSGFYIASGDASGKLRIWDTTQKEHLLKYEYQPLAGTVKDISWSEDSKRICIVGEGREMFASVIMWDTGTSCGSLLGHSKSINACDIKPNRPYRLVTASEDYHVAFFEGPPFKFKQTFRNHTNFVNCVRYAPDGSVYISGGADKRAHVFEGKAGEYLGELESVPGCGTAHEGGIYGLSFSPDSKKVATVSGDKSVRIWDVEGRKLLSTTKMGTTIDDMQLGCIWIGDTVVSVSLSGFLNYIDPECPDAPSKIVKGHSGSVISMALSEDKKTVFSGDFKGYIVYWNVEDDNCDILEGRGHNNQVTDMCIHGNKLVSVGIDDQIIFSNVDTKKYGTTLSLPSQPRRVAAGANDLVVVSCQDQVVMYQNDKKLSELPVTYGPSGVAISRDGKEVAVGSNEEKKIIIYTVCGDKLEEKKTLDSAGKVTDLKYSPNGEYFVAVDDAKRTSLYSMPDYQLKHRDMWSKHQAKIWSVAFSPNSQNICTGSLDTNLGFYHVDKNQPIGEVRGAHPLSCVNRVDWLTDDTVITAGHGGCINIWQRN